MQIVDEFIPMLRWKHLILPPVKLPFFLCSASPVEELIWRDKKKMPKDKSIKSILLIGSGPIVIGQACEFDYSGSQASRSLREEGIEVILINSNPATIMTDPVTADHVYL